MIARYVLGVVVTAALMAPIVGLARAPYRPPGADAAVLRLSWRMTVQARENCRSRTPEELAALPAHMRSPEVCEADDAAYALITRIDSATADTAHLIRGGIKEDRPLFVLDERSLEPGEHRVRVQLHRLTQGRGDSTLVSLDTVVVMETGRVRLVTLRPDGEGLEVR